MFQKEYGWEFSIVFKNKKNKFFILFLITACIFTANSIASYVKTGIRVFQDNKQQNEKFFNLKTAKKIYSISRYNQNTFFKASIQEFKKQDKTMPPSAGSILFIGSSSIRLWKNLNSDFSNYRVLNRGFGGAQISHINYYFNQLITAYKPKGIVFFF